MALLEQLMSGVKPVDPMEAFLGARKEIRAEESHLQQMANQDAARKVAQLNIEEAEDRMQTYRMGAEQRQLERDASIKRLQRDAELSDVQHEQKVLEAKESLKMQPAKALLGHLKELEGVLHSIDSEEVLQNAKENEPELMKIIAEDLNKSPEDLTMKDIQVMRKRTPYEMELIKKQAEIDALTKQKTVVENIKQQTSILKDKTKKEIAELRIKAKRMEDAGKIELASGPEIGQANLLITGQGDITGYTPQQVNALAVLLANRAKSFLQAARADGLDITASEAIGDAYSELVQDIQTMEKYESKSAIVAKITGKSLPPVKTKENKPTAAATERFVVGGKEYNIPADKVEAFKKAKGIK